MFIATLYGFTFHRSDPCRGDYSSSAATLEAEGVGAPSPHRCIALPFQHSLIREGYRYGTGQRRASSVWLAVRFLRVMSPLTRTANDSNRTVCHWGIPKGRNPVLRLRVGGSHGVPADIGTPRSIVDGPLIPGPSATGQPTAHCLIGPGAAHPHVASPQAWFCQRLLDGRGPAQVGFDPNTSESHRLRLSPLDIRLTPPFRVLSSGGHCARGIKG